VPFPVWSGGECGQIVSDLGVGGGREVDSAPDQEVESEVAAAFGPLVGLLGQDAPTNRTMASRLLDQRGLNCDFAGYCSR
jgi:hypothetical protein